jgi:UPF0716 family protein affecting phage T7 exclusion
MMRTTPETGLLGKAITLIAGAVLLVLGFMFSLVLLAVIAVAGLAAWGYFWWKTRALRKAMQEQPLNPPGDGHVIEGEAVVIEEYRASVRRELPPGADRP